jgi:peptidoglycan/LPS O-acetylase OafA/YrhL
MKKLYAKLFGSENPVISVAFMCIIYVAIHFSIKLFFSIDHEIDYNMAYLTFDAPGYLIYEFEKVEWLQWLTLALGIAGYAAIVIYNGGLGYGEGDKTFGYYFLAGALIVISGFFPAIFGQNKEKYRKKLDEPTFQYYKANPSKSIELFTK